MVIGALEAGGTKMVCAIGNDQGIIQEKKMIATSKPDHTIPEMIHFFRKFQLDAIGIGCFGPLDLRKSSDTYGMITSTPKYGWKNIPILDIFQNEFKIPVGFDTDVNAAALGEVVYGIGKGCNQIIYITIGTGIGVGVYMNGSLLHGLVHPEAGHIMLSRKAGDSMNSVCSYHENCFEGLASGSALWKRCGYNPAELGDDSPIWEMESYYIAQAISNYILTYSPEKIILSGGVMHQKHLFGLVRKKVKKILNGYVSHPVLESDLSDYIVPAALKDNAGIIGALELGKRALVSLDR